MIHTRSHQPASEWGPAHHRVEVDAFGHRVEAVAIEVEPTDRPDDN